ncbi:MAG: hypothetical protein Kapaf2KO_06140 [Candidatus Kapaibacteriales bacterium]
MFEIFSQIPIDILNWTQEILVQVPPAWVYLIAFITTFIENIVPPSPSDAVLLFIGTLVVFSGVSFPLLLTVATLGSTVGFVTMYLIGSKTGDKILKGDRFTFINPESMKKPTEWFQKYGYGIIIANRFLAGTRALISFFAGLTKLDLKKTTILSALSATVWNVIILYLGIKFADNLDVVKEYIALYGKIVFPIILGILIIIVIRSFYLKNKKNRLSNQ